MAWVIWNVALSHVHIITNQLQFQLSSVIGYSARGRLKMEMPTTTKHKMAPLLPDLTPKWIYKWIARIRRFLSVFQIVQISSYQVGPSRAPLGSKLAESQSGRDIACHHQLLVGHWDCNKHRPSSLQWRAWHGAQPRKHGLKSSRYAVETAVQRVGTLEAPK